MENKRRKYYIKRGFQTRFIVKFLALALGGGILIGAILYLYATGTQTASFSGGKLHVVDTGYFLLPSLMTGIIVSFLVVGIFAAIMMLFTSHKIAGPLYRFEKSCEEIARGNLSFNVRVRQYDQLQEMGRNFNDMIQALNNMVSDVKHSADRVDAALKEGKLDEKAAREASQELKRNIDKFKL